MGQAKRGSKFLGLYPLQWAMIILHAFLLADLLLWVNIFSLLCMHCELQCQACFCLACHLCSRSRLLSTVHFQPVHSVGICCHYKCARKHQAARLVWFCRIRICEPCFKVGPSLCMYTKLSDMQFQKSYSDVQTPETFASAYANMFAQNLWNVYFQWLCRALVYSSEEPNPSSEHSHA